MKIGWPSYSLGMACFLGASSLACSSEDPADSESSTDATEAGATSTQTSGASDAAGSSASNTSAAAGATTSSGTGAASVTGGTSGNSTTNTSGASTQTSGAGGATSTTANTTTGGNTSCTFDVDYELSSAIATVGIVTWSTDLAGLDSAHIDFGLSDADFGMQAPVDLSLPDYRTLLLGMKGEQDYSFRIVASAGGQTCTSDTYSLTTGPVSNSVPTMDRTVENAALVAPGFFVAASGLGGGGGGGGGGSSMAFILDADGDVVWWAEAPGGTGRVRMNWEGTDMWMMSVNNGGGMGEMRRVSMDGLDVEPNVAGLENAHHDFTVLPEGVLAVIMYLQGAGDGCSTIVARAPDGTITPIVEDVSTLYQPVGECHPNAIHYHRADDSFTLSDRNPNMFVKFTHAGELEWQFGGENPLGAHYPGSWNVNHGHHLLDNGNFLFFNNGQAQGASPAREFSLNSSTMTATEVWTYTSDFNSGTLGDVQRLPNGNTIVAYSNSGVIHEVDPDGNLVQELATASLGYVDHRPSLYGDPPR